MPMWNHQLKQKFFNIYELPRLLKLTSGTLIWKCVRLTSQLTLTLRCINFKKLLGYLKKAKVSNRCTCMLWLIHFINVFLHISVNLCQWNDASFERSFSSLWAVLFGSKLAYDCSGYTHLLFATKNWAKLFVFFAQVFFKQSSPKHLLSTKNDKTHITSSLNIVMNNIPNLSWSKEAATIF